MTTLCMENILEKNFNNNNYKITIESEEFIKGT